jgi:hypothetical protein
MQIVKFADADNDEKDGPDSPPSDNLYVKNLPLQMNSVGRFIRTRASGFLFASLGNLRVRHGSL